MILVCYILLAAILAAHFAVDLVELPRRKSYWLGFADIVIDLCAFFALIYLGVSAGV